MLSENAKATILRSRAPTDWLAKLLNINPQTVRRIRRTPQAQLDEERTELHRAIAAAEGPASYIAPEFGVSTKTVYRVRRKAREQKATELLKKK